MDIGHNCEADEITIQAGTEIDDQTYYFSDPAEVRALTPVTLVQTKDHCPVTCTLVKTGDANYPTELVKAFDASNG